MQLVNSRRVEKVSQMYSMYHREQRYLERVQGNFFTRKGDLFENKYIDH